MQLKEVDNKLASHGMIKGLARSTVDERDLQILAEYDFSYLFYFFNTLFSRHLIRFNDLESFVRGLRMSNKPVSWNDARAKIAQRFDLKHDAENHWARCYSDQHPRCG